MADLNLIEHPEDEISAPTSADRRQIMAALAGGTLLAVTSLPASAQVTSSVDTAPLQFALNLHYLGTNFLQVVIYGEGRQLPAEKIRGGELSGDAGVPATSVEQVSFPVASRAVQIRLQEIADSHWYRVETLRAYLRGDCPAQTLIDYSAERFTSMFRLAGAIGATETFDPYESPNNCLLAAETLLSVQASVYASILASMSNDVAMAMMASITATATNDLVNVRAMLNDAAQSDPTILTMLDKLAAWRNQVDGTATTDRAVSPVMGTTGIQTRLAPIDQDGLLLGRSPQQALNVLFFSQASVSQGGFYPNGVAGTIVRSAAN